MTAAERRSPRPSSAATREWLWRLWAIGGERQTAAQARISRWAIPHVSRELDPLLADGAVAAVLLTESVDVLISRGVSEERLVAKLRRDPDMWPTWAEIHAAGVLAKHTHLGHGVALEPDRRRGAHSDLAFVDPDGSRHAIEFKAIGLSDFETAFCRSVAPLTSALHPRVGLLQMHVQDMSLNVALDRDQRRTQRANAEAHARSLPDFIRPVTSSMIVGHGSEDTYVRRLRSRFEETFRQFNASDSCWAAFHWSNGASRKHIRRALATTSIPDHIRGIILVGTTANTYEMASYIIFAPRPFDTSTGEELYIGPDAIPATQASAELERIDTSSGVRTAVIRVPWHDRRVDFLVRDGSRRILPFNVLLSPDPTGPQYRVRER